MESKWLSWTPADTEIIGKARQEEVTKPTKPGFGSFGGPIQQTFSIIRGEEPTETDRDRRYVAAFEATMNKMRANPMPEACLPWLAAHHPGLYRLLTRVLADKLEEIETDPGYHLNAFEWVLDRIWDANRNARKLYAEWRN